MRIGDMLTQKSYFRDGAPALLLVLGISRHPESPEKDRIQLQWISRTGETGLQAEFSRYIVEKRYEVV
mgnify:CR=1 FL=1